MRWTGCGESKIQGECDVVGESIAEADSYAYLEDEKMNVCCDNNSRDKKNLPKSQGRSSGKPEK